MLAGATHAGATNGATEPRETTPKPKPKRVRGPRADTRKLKILALSGDVHALKLQIARLQQVRELLQEKTVSRADSLAGSVSKIVRTYFQIFADGFHPTVTLPGARVVETTRFLTSIMDEDILCGGFRGVKTMAENGQRFNAVFNNVHLKLTDLRIVPLDDAADDSEGRILATATVTHSGHITLKTIEILFPHILSDAALVMSLLGRAIAGQGLTTFTYDCRTRRIISCFIDIDMVGTFAAVVERPSDLAVLFKMAQITADGFIGDRDVIPTDKAVAPTLVAAERQRTRKAMAMESILSGDETASTNEMGHASDTMR